MAQDNTRPKETENNVDHDTQNASPQMIGSEMAKVRISALSVIYPQTQLADLQKNRLFKTYKVCSCCHCIAMLR